MCQFIFVFFIVVSVISRILSHQRLAVHSARCISEVDVILRLSHYPRSVTGHRVPNPDPRLPESLSGFEMGELIEAKPLIAISL